MSEQQLNAEQKAKLDSMTSLLDGTLDDMKIFPGFIQLPTGAYKVKLAEGFRNKIISEKAAIDLPMTVVEIIELGNPEQAPEVKVGDIATLAWMMDKKQARDFSKKQSDPSITFLNAKSYNEAMTNSKGLDVIIVVVRTHNKEKQRDFMQLRSSQSRKYERTHCNLQSGNVVRHLCNLLSFNS